MKLREARAGVAAAAMGAPTRPRSDFSEASSLLLALRRGAGGRWEACTRVTVAQARPRYEPDPAELRRWFEGECAACRAAFSRYVRNPLFIVI